MATTHLMRFLDFVSAFSLMVCDHRVVTTLRVSFSMAMARTCMCVSMYVCEHVLACLCMCMAGLSMFVYGYMYVCMCGCVRMQVPTHARIYILAYVRIDAIGCQHTIFRAHDFVVDVAYP